tara:strand:- start:663 stop:980 length:318 start_codon:yes stop_codon:yes gene_type:complete
MKPNNVLLRIEKEANDQLIKNKIKINRFVSKYKYAKQCFYSDDENDDLFNFLYDISNEYDIQETEVFTIFVESKYKINGEISKHFEDDFALQITILETINNNNDD